MQINFVFGLGSTFWDDDFVTFVCACDNYLELQQLKHRRKDN